MNITKKLDDWYKEWCGDHHTINSNKQVHDSAQAQDFAEYCIDEYKKIVSEDKETEATALLHSVSPSVFILKINFITILYEKFSRKHRRRRGNIRRIIFS